MKYQTNKVKPTSRAVLDVLIHTQHADHSCLHGIFSLVIDKNHKRGYLCESRADTTKENLWLYGNTLECYQILRKLLKEKFHRGKIETR